MTQILGSVAYCRERDLTVVISDRIVTNVAQIAPGFYGIVIDGKKPEPVCKVRVSGNHIFGLGGRYPSGMDSNMDTISRHIEETPDHARAYELFIDSMKGLGNDENTYIFGTFGQRPRFKVGALEKGKVVKEESMDSCALHRNNDGSAAEYDEYAKHWLKPEWLKGTVYHERAFRDGKYMPTLDIISHFFIEDMNRESKDGLGVSREWDVLIETGGQILTPDIYSSGLRPVDFLRNARRIITSTDDDFLRELYARLAIGGLGCVSQDVIKHYFFPADYVERNSRIWDTFYLTLNGEGLKRERMEEDEIKALLEYIDMTEKLFLGELPRI